MALTVVVRSGDTSGPTTITFDAPRIVIGRGEGCEVRLPDPSVSHRHASIRQRGNDYVIVNEGSTNGTFAGPVKLSPQAPRVLRQSELLRVGRIWLEVRAEQAVPTANPQETTREIALALVQGAMQAQGEPLVARIVVEQGPDEGKQLALADFERTYVIGRAPDADLVISDNDASRRHVEITRRGDQVCIKDLGSKNGSTLDDARLVAGKETRWPPGLRLAIGTTRLSLDDPLVQALAELEGCSDEAMQNDERVNPPAPEGESSPAPAEPRGRAAAAPLVEAPRPALAAERTSGGRFRTANLFVALLALAVLTLSLLGLSWVLRSN